jgi:hypothetical protein
MAQLRFSNYLVVAGGVLVVALSLSFTYVSPVGGAESKEVTVINTPLPVQGTVNVGNFPASNAVTGSVSITGTPNVNVVNTLVPFGANLCVQNVVAACPPGQARITVPSATSTGSPVKWLVIEQVGGNCSSFTSGVFITPSITFGFPPDNSAQGPIQLFFHFPVNLTDVAGFGPNGVFQSSVRIYVRAGFFVFGGFTVLPHAADALCFLTLTGHLET